MNTKAKTINEQLNDFDKRISGLNINKGIRLIMFEVLSLKQEIQELREEVNLLNTPITPDKRYLS
jgi:hypothetical protein